MSDIYKKFNNLAEDAPRQYTLGEWLCPSRYDNILNFTRGGRMIERTYTGLGAAFAAVVVTGGAHNLPLSLLVAGTGLAACKVKGVVMGKLADYVLRNPA